MRLLVRSVLLGLVMTVLGCGSSEDSNATPAPASPNSAPSPIDAATDAPVVAGPEPEPEATLPAADDPWNQPRKPPSEDPTEDLPTELASWLPANGVAAWSGSSTGYMPTLANWWPDPDVVGDPVALKIERNRVAFFDGKLEADMRFSIDLPCAAMFRPDHSSGAAATGRALREKNPLALFDVFDRIAVRFAIQGGRVIVGEGAVGLRRGKAAVVCGPLQSEVFVLEPDGDCYRRQNKKRLKAACVWVQRGNRTTLVVGCEKCFTNELVLVADGNVLWSDAFRKNARPLVKTKDFAAAKQWATSKHK